jgi:hypothetical protein
MCDGSRRIAVQGTECLEDQRAGEAGGPGRASERKVIRLAIVGVVFLVLNLCLEGSWIWEKGRAIDGREAPRQPVCVTH